MFYHFRQNNSGGSFTGPAINVIIEAANADAANALAETHGIYFDGCEIQMDCPCCGDRWCRVYGEGDPEPMIYGSPVGPKSTEQFLSGLYGSILPAVVYYADGREVKHDAS